MPGDDKRRCLECGLVYSAATDSDPCPRCLFRVGDTELTAGEAPNPVNHHAGAGDSGQVGPYRILEKIGEGGFGTVYRAEQSNPVRRDVALKMIKPGMDTRQIIARFEAERRALAMMEHPAIARVFDAGASDAGRPYFAMELVGGTPIDRFCSDHRLDVSGRLNLFIPVCHAVQHAHQKGIIHRDIKPSNILVSMVNGKPEPKIIDFGIAKATIPDSPDFVTITRQGQVFGTPAYMSPEQAAHDEDIDTRSDIYSLGMVLFQLLSGRLPFDDSTIRNRDWITWLQVIREGDLPSLSSRFKAVDSSSRQEIASRACTSPVSLNRILRGDLNCITRKALENERNRRYESAAELSRDIERYLHFLPVSAASTSLGYTIRKFGRRHRALLSASALILSLLLAGMGFAFWQKYRFTSQLALQETLDNARREAQITPFSNVAGRRAMGWAAIRTAAAIEPSVELRGDAVACLAMTDLEPEPAHTIPGFEGASQPLAVDQAVERYAHCSSDGTVSVRTLATNEEVLRLPPREFRPDRLHFSPDGNYLAIGHTGTPRFWHVRDLDTDMTIGEEGDFVADTLAFSPDSRWIAMGRGGENPEIEVRHLREPDRRYVTALERRPTRLRFQPSGPLLAVQSQESLNLFIVQWRTSEIKKVYFPAPLTDLAWHPDGHMLGAACEDRLVYLCQRITGDALADPFPMRRDAISAHHLTFSSDGNLLATADTVGLVQLWDPFTGTNHVRLRTGCSIRDLRFSPDDRRLGFGIHPTESTLNIWNVVPHTIAQPLKHNVDSQRFAAKPLFGADGRVLFCSSDNGVRIWDWATRRYLGSLITGPVESLAYNPEHHDLFLTCPSGLFRIQMQLPREHHLSAGRLRQFQVDRSRIPRSVSVGTGGRTLAAVAGEELLLYSPRQSPSSVAPIATKNTVGMALHPTKPIAAVIDGTENRLLIYDSENWNLLLERPTGARSLGFSPQGSYLATNTADGTQRIYETSSWREIFQGTPPIKSLVAPAFDRTEETVAIVPNRFRIDLISLPGMATITRLPTMEHAAVSGITFSPSESVLAVAYEDQTCQIWDLAAARTRLQEIGLGWPGTHSDGRSPPKAPLTWSARDDLFGRRGIEHLPALEALLVNGNTLEKAIASSRLGEYGQSESYYEKAFEQSSPAPRDIAALGLACLNQGKIDKAERVWKDCLDKFPNYHPALVQLAFLFLRADVGGRDQEKLNEGMRLADEIGKNGASSPIDRFYSASVHALAAHRARDFSESMRHAIRAREIGELEGYSMPDLLFLQAMNYYEKGQLSEAEKLFSEGYRRWQTEAEVKEAQHSGRTLRLECLEKLAHPNPNTSQ